MIEERAVDELPAIQEEIERLRNPFARELAEQNLMLSIIDSFATETHQSTALTPTATQPPAPRTRRFGNPFKGLRNFLRRQNR